jgi:hypothetical protein
VDLSSDTHPDKGSHLNHGKVFFPARYERFGGLGDLDQSIRLDEAASKCKANGPSPAILDDLGSSFVRLLGNAGRSE